MDMVAFFKNLLDERARLDAENVLGTTVQMTVKGARNCVTIFIDMMPVIDRLVDRYLRLNTVVINVISYLCYCNIILTMC